MIASSLKDQLDYSKNTTQTNVLPQLVNKKGILYPAHATYALKRRMIVPRWWVENILFTSGKKYAWYDSFITEHFDKKIYEYFKVTSVNMFFMIFLWDELIRKFFSAENQTNKKITIDLTPFLIGTEKQKASILKKIEENLIKPISVFEVKQTEKTKQATYEKNGYLNIFKKVHLVQDVHGVWLTLDFAQNPFNIFGSPEVKSKKYPFKDCFITVNPNLFYAMGSRVNLEKALNGLFLEYNKQNEDLDPLHTSFDIDSEKIAEFHAHAASTAERLYNHGILNGASIAPGTKISSLRRLQKNVNAEENSPFLFVWNFSSQTKEARNFEASLSKQLNDRRQNNTKAHLFYEPPKDELKQIRTIPPQISKTPDEVAVSVSLPLKKEPVSQTLPAQESIPSTVSPTKEQPMLPTEKHVSPFPLPKFMQNQQQKPNFHTFSERELTIFVARFYETLSPKQKQMFESERRSMTREQFRAFMIPILQRTHATLPV